MSESKLGVTPLHNRVIVQRFAVEEKTAGGLFIPDTVKDKEKPSKGEVLAIGPGNLCEDGKRFPMSVKVGDKVLFAKYAGIELDIGTHLDCIIMHDHDIVAILD